MGLKYMFMCLFSFFFEGLKLLDSAGINPLLLISSKPGLSIMCTLATAVWICAVAMAGSFKETVCKFEFIPCKWDSMP